MPYTKAREFHDAQMQAIQSAIMSKAIADQLLSPAEHNPSQSWGVAMALLQAAFKKGEGSEIHHHHFCGNPGDVHCMTHKERANKRLAMAEDLFSLCRQQTAKEWQECLEIAWKLIV